MKYTVNKIIVALILILALFPNVSAQELANVGVNEMQTVKCVLTGYYSPLPDQARYVTGSYASDIRLNGGGIRGADGTGVYPGMIAAPKNIPFGTKIEIPGFGIGTVHDRGGAIKSYSDSNGAMVYRFDIWLGHGDEGLIRALNVGVRSTICTIYNTSNLSDNISLQPVSVPAKKTYYNPDLPLNNFELGDTHEELVKVQNKLKELGYFDFPSTGYFGEMTLNAIIAFQIDQKIINNADGYGAGYIGPKTKKILFSKDTSESQSKPINKDDNIVYEIDNQSFIISAGLGKDAEGAEVRKLQQILNHLGYYDQEINGEYDMNTINAVIEFQKQQGIIQEDTELGAGYYGTKTNIALIDVLNNGISNSNAEVKPIAKKEYEFKKSVFRIEKDFPVFKKALFVYNSNTLPIVAQSSYTKSLSRGDQNPEVLKFQGFLNTLGYLNAEPTGFFGPLTEKAVLSFQQEHKIISGHYDLGAGMIGPKTRKKFEEVTSLHAADYIPAG